MVLFYFSCFSISAWMFYENWEHFWCLSQLCVIFFFGHKKRIMDDGYNNGIVHAFGDGTQVITQSWNTKFSICSSQVKREPKKRKEVKEKSMSEKQHIAAKIKLISWKYKRVRFFLSPCQHGSATMQRNTSTANGKHKFWWYCTYLQWKKMNQLTLKSYC